MDDKSSIIYGTTAAVIILLIIITGIFGICMGIVVYKKKVKAKNIAG